MRACSVDINLDSPKGEIDMANPKTLFSARDFVNLDCGNSEKVYLSAADKAKTCALFVRFVESGFSFNIWKGHRALYVSLNSMYGHIAHFNSDGFFSTWFVSARHQIAFLQRARDWRVFYGDPRHTRSDMERALTSWICMHPEIISALVASVDSAIETSERADLARLKAKYENLTPVESEVKRDAADVKRMEETRARIVDAAKDSGRLIIGKVGAPTSKSMEKRLAIQREAPLTSAEGDSRRRP